LEKIILNNQNLDIYLWDLSINLIVAFILGTALALVYKKFGNAISNRNIFSNNFVLIITTTTLMIFVVKSSLALSLGLVGALSIVRFRAAIKEPEELAYLFLAIAVGVGLGANYTILICVAFVMIVFFIILQSFYFVKSESSKEMFCNISINKKIILSDVLSLIKNNSTQVLLRDFDISDDFSQLGVVISFKNTNQLETISNEIEKNYSGATIKFLDNSMIS
jgi:uncharacterized membrane protein YhiD involved in acid resistance